MHVLHRHGKCGADYTHCVSRNASYWRSKVAGSTADRCESKQNASRQKYPSSRIFQACVLSEDKTIRTHFYNFFAFGTRSFSGDRLEGFHGYALVLSVKTEEFRGYRCLLRQVGFVRLLVRCVCQIRSDTSLRVLRIDREFPRWK